MILVRVQGSTDAMRRREQQEMLATLAAFGLPLRVILAQDAIGMLAPESDGADLLGMLPAMGVDEVLVESADTAAVAAPAGALLPWRPVLPEQVAGLLDEARHTFNL